MDKVCALINEQFVWLHSRSQTLIRAMPSDKLYWQPRESHETMPVYSCGEHVLRSAGVVEQTFGGLSANLWDDPFEWTLPETLSTSELVNAYLEEVETTRQRGFELFKTDHDLLKEIVVPSGDTQTIFALLLDTLVKASRHQGCAIATFRLFSDARITTH